jgi:hypothetical protein
MNKLSASALGIVAVVFIASSTGCAAESPAESLSTVSSPLTNSVLASDISGSPALGRVIAASYLTTSTGNRNDVMFAMNDLRATHPVLASFDPAEARDIVGAAAGQAITTSGSSPDPAGATQASACVRSCRGQWYSAAAACGFFAPTLVGAAVCAGTAMVGLHYCKVGCEEGRAFSPVINPLIDLSGIDPKSVQLDPEEQQFFDVLLAPPPPPPETCTYIDVSDAERWCPNGFRGCAVGYACTN